MFEFPTREVAPHRRWRSSRACSTASTSGELQTICGIPRSTGLPGAPTSRFPAKRVNRRRRSRCSTVCSIWCTSAIPRITSGTPYSTERRGRPTSRSRIRRARLLPHWPYLGDACTWFISAIPRTTSGIPHSTERHGRRMFASRGRPARLRRRWPRTAARSTWSILAIPRTICGIRPSTARPWVTNVRIKNQSSKGAPALAAYGGRLQLVHLDDASISCGTRSSTARGARMCRSRISQVRSASASAHFRLSWSWCTSEATRRICGKRPYAMTGLPVWTFALAAAHARGF